MKNMGKMDRNVEMMNKATSRQSGIAGKCRYGRSPGRRALSLLLAVLLGIGGAISGIGDMVTKGGVEEIYADNTTDINSGGTVPVGEYDGTHNIYTVHDNTAAVTGDTIVGSGNPYTVSNVVQSRSTNSATTFAAGLPLSTIYIDQSKITGDANAKNCTFQALPGPYSSAITRNAGSGFITYDALTGPKQILGGQINTLEGPLFYVEFPNAAILPNGDKANLRITYSDARIVVDQRYDAIKDQAGNTVVQAAAYAGKIRLATGPQISYGGEDGTDITGMYRATDRQAAVVKTAQKYNTNQTFSSNSFKKPFVGMSIDATYQIVDNNGTPVPGTFIFAIAGINLDRDPYRGVNAGNNAAKPLWYVNDMPGGSEYHFFSEAMSINSGMASDNIYVRSRDNGDIGDDNKITPTTDWRPNNSSPYYPVKRINQANFWPQVTKDSNGNTKFIGNAYGNSPQTDHLFDDSQGSDTTYSNGFVTLADAAAGLKVTATGHGGSGSYYMNTTTFVSETIWYRYTSGSGNHGKIELTDEGNPGGTLRTGSVLDGGKNPHASDATSADKPNVYVVTEGKTVTYTMTPDIGYQIKKLTINRNEVKLTNGDIKNVDLSQMKRGDTVTVETNDYSYWDNPDTLETRDPSKGQGILTYNADGTYTFKFNHAKADEEIFVEWEPVTADILTYKIWDDNNDKDGIRYNADTTQTLPKFKLQYSLNGRTWNDVTNTVNIGNHTYTLKKPVTEQTVPAGKDNNNKYVDGTYVINNDPNKNSNDPDVKKHPFTWEHLPVYTYDSNGTAGKAIQYRIVEVNDPWHSEYKEAEYYDLEVFDLTSDKVKSIDGWGIYTDGTTSYVQKEDGEYYIVDMTDGSVANTPASTQPDPDNLDPYVDSDSWTVDKAIPYQEVKAKNTHFTTEYFVEVTKKWDDAALLNQQTTSGINQYARKDIYIVLHGETVDGAVDLNGSSVSGKDLKKEIKTTELGVKANVTGNKTIDNYTLYENGTNQYALVENDTNHADGYYTVSGNAIDYTSGPLDPAPIGLTVVKKGDGTYKINDNDFGAMFEDLPTHYNGKEITYTVKETDTSGNELTEWIMTGGELSPVTDNDKNVLGYETTMRNTPDVDEIYNKLPLTIVKQDINSKGKLEGAEFTIYTDAVVGDKAPQSETKKVGEKVYTKTEHDEATNTDITKNYVIRKDVNDGDKYKYYEVASDDTVSATPAKPQPVSLDLTDNGVLGGGEDAYTDGTKTYVLRSGSYHLVNTDGSIAAAPANPQPDANLIKAAKDETTGAVKENVVTTNAAGEAYVSFLKTGTYYIKETKAPEGYNVDPTTYAFKVDAELKSITLESVNGEHTTTWWKKLYDLIFGNSGASYGNWTPNTNKKGGILTVDDSPIVANVLVRKYWNDSDNQDGKRPGDRENPSSTDDSRLDPEFKLPTVTLQYTTGAHTATGLNVYTDGAATNPKKYVLKNNQYYEVTAEDVTGEYQTSAASTQPTGATASSETCAGLTVYTDSNNKKYVIIDNAYYEVNSVDTKGSIASSPAATQPDENLLSLVMDGGWTTVQVKDDNDNLVDAKNKVNYVGGPVLTNQNDAYTWNNLPAYRDGMLVTYRILEEDDPEGKMLRDHIYDIESNHTSQTHDKTFHLANTSGAKPTALNQTVDVTNRHDPQVINIEAYKKWEDEDPGDRSTSTIRLYKVVNGIETVVSTVSGDTTLEDKGTVPVEDKTDAIKVWKDLPTYEGGNPVTYRLKEESIEGYNTHYSAIYTKTDGNPIDTESQDILAEDVKRTFYAQGDTLPEGKKVGDENTTAKFEILNERSVNVKVSKTWRNGANANVRYELWRTIKKENELTSSAFTSTPVSDTDSNRYYIHKTTKAIITAETYEQMTAEDKANYDIETVRTWSPYAGGGKDGDPSDAVDGWKLVSTHLFDSNDFENVATGKTVEYAFNNMDIKDINGNEYLYRVLEKPALNRFRENQISNTEIINNNVNVSDGNVSLEVVKELEGRFWMDKDDFKFYLEAVNGKNVTDPANPVDVAQNMVPMPYRIDPATSKTTYNYTADATKTDLQVGALGRAATFQGIQYKQNSNLYQSIGVGETYEFYYKVYEIYDTKTVKDETNNTETVTKDTGLDEATDHTGTKDGITYDGEVEPGGLLTADEFKPTVHEARVIVKNVNGNISTEIQWKKNGNYVTGAVPVYTNTYSSKGTAKLWVEKEIKNRAWVDYNNSAKTGDAFEFKIDSISGSQLNVPGSTTSDSYTTKPLMSNAANNPQSDIQKMSDTEYAFGVNGNKYDNTMLNSNGIGYFIYEISEDGKINSYSDDHFNITDYTVDGLNYDPNKKYIKVKAQDNWDGTISFTIEYFTDASCKENYKINGYKAWIHDDGTQTNEGKRLLSMTEAARAEGMTKEQRDEAGYRQVDVAHFTNYENIDIPVKKEWTDGPAVEDVNLHLKRHLFQITGTGAVAESSITDAYVKKQEEDWKGGDNNPFWQTAGYTHISKRGDFLENDGTPIYNDGENKSSQTYGDNKAEDGTTLEKPDFIEGFNQNLPKYIVGDGKNGTISGETYRVVYSLYEDDTSNAYTRKYKSINNGTETEDDYIFTDGDTLVVTNKVVATNTANPAAVKQLQGRVWSADDDFKFILTPKGKAEYNADGSIASIDDTAVIPMPTEGKYAYKQDGSDVISAEEYEALTAEEKDKYEAVQVENAEAHAKIGETTVDPNGNLERLARFNSIEFDLSDLEYNKTNKHYQGDFFYEMKEDIPNTAVAYDKATGEKVLDDNDEEITFTEEDRDKYDWKGSDGITYDADVHTVHIKVRENRTKDFQVQIAYDEDETPIGDITTGTQFTPVYTNTYDAEGFAEESVDKYIMGRDWVQDETFTFVVQPLGSSPFFDENGDRIGDSAEVTMTVSDTTLEKQSVDLAKLYFTLSDLPWTVGANGAKDLRGIGTETTVKYSDGTVVPEGTKYGRFVYAIRESGASASDIEIDPDTEYIRLTVIDKGDGTLDTNVAVFEDRYCTESARRYDPVEQEVVYYEKNDDSSVRLTEEEYNALIAEDSTQEDNYTRKTEKKKVYATAPTFVNQLKRDLSATKAWAGVATSDVTLKLQWSVNGVNFYDVAGTSWFDSSIVGTQTIKKDATGDDLTVTWENLPAYANIEDANDQTGDDIDLNDKWIYYQIVEEPVSNVTIRYNETPYAAGDTVDTKTGDKNKYIVQGDKGTGITIPTESEKTTTTDEETQITTTEWTSPRVEELYVTNFPDELSATTTFGVVKQYIGKAWVDETFTFQVEPVKSKLGSATEYTNYADQPATKKMPTMGNNNTATATSETSKVSVNEHAANFGNITIKRSDLALDDKAGSETKGMLTGEFIYKITEVIPSGAEDAGAGYKVATDEHGNNIKYTMTEHTVKIVAVDDGTGNIKLTVSYDDRPTGQYVPVYTNYALMKTPIKGTKTWVGGENSEHINGTVTLGDDDFTIVDAYDARGLQLQRRLASEEPSAATAINGDNTDDAGRELVIVWVKEETGTRTKQEGGDGSGPYWYTVKAKVETTEEVEGQTVTKTTYEEPYLNMVNEDGIEYVYSIKETNVPEKYTESYDGLNVTNTYNVTDTIKVTKTWDDNQDAAGLRPESITVYLYKVVPIEGGQADETDVVQVEVAKKEIKPTSDETDEWKTGITWEDLPVYDENGDIIKYVVTEESVSGYTATYKLRDGEYKSEGDEALIIELDDNEDAETIDIKNSLTPSTNEVKVTKVWDDNDNKDDKRPESVTFKLYKYVWDSALNDGNGGYGEKQLMSGESGTGRPATSVDVAANSISSAVPGSTPGTGTTITVGSTIKINDLVLNGTTDEPKNTQANETDAWVGSWINLPAEENGKAVLYVVEEETTGDVFADPGTPGTYSNKPCVTGDQVSGFTVKNTFTPDERNVITVLKKWDDDNDHDGKRPDSVSVQLYQNDEPVDDYVETLSDVNNWTAVFNLAELPLTDESGTPYTYDVFELKGEGDDAIAIQDGATTDAGYTVSYDKKADETNPNKVTLTVTNSLKPETVDITATKVWDGEPSYYDAKTDSYITDTSMRGDVVLHLYGKVDGAIVFEAGTKTISKTAEEGSEDVEAVWKNLPKYHFSKKEMKWEIVEESIFGYSTSYEWNDDGTECTVTNTYNEPTSMIEVEKVWEDDSDRDGKRPAKITFELWKKVGDSDPEMVESQTVDVDPSIGTAEYAWVDLPVVEEQPATTEQSSGATAGGTSGATAGAETSSAGTQTTETLVSETKTKTEEQQVTDDDGNLLYVNKDDKDDTITEAELNALQKEDGTPIDPSDYEPLMKEVEVKYEVATIEETEVTETKLVPILYTVKEKYDKDEAWVDYYDEPVVESVEPGYFRVINTRTEYDTTGITVNKTWHDNNDEYGLRPDHIRIKILADGEEYMTDIITAEDNWIKSYSNLPKFGGKKDEEGNPIAIKYTVEENGVTGYSIGYSGNDRESTTGEIEVINTLDPNTKTVEVTKKWFDADGNEKLTAQAKATFYLVKVVGSYGPQRVEGSEKTINLGDNGVILRWENLPGTQDGFNVEYTVEEEVEGYKSVVGTGTTTEGVTRIEVTNTEIKDDEPVDPTPGSDPVTPTPTTTKVAVTYIDPLAQINDSTKSMALVKDVYEGDTPEIAADKAKKAADEKHNAPDLSDAHTADGYTFVGWNIEQDRLGNYILVAKYNKTADPAKKIVTYIDGQADGANRVVKTGDASDASAAAPPESNPNHADENLVFQGWGEPITDSAGNIIYVAKYACECRNTPTPVDPTPSVPTHWVTYVDPDGTVYVAKTTISAGQAEPAVPADPTKDGYTFGGWVRTTDAEGNVTYTAKWLENAKPDDPTPTDPEKPDDPTPVNPDPEKPDDPTPPAPETHWVQYVDENGNIIYMPKVVVNGDEDEPAPPADPTRDGYVFDGWDRQVDDNGNVTYTATWKPESKTEPTPTKPEKPAENVPKTGDANDMVLWAVLLAGSTAAAVLARRRQENRQ